MAFSCLIKKFQSMHLGKRVQETERPGELYLCWLRINRDIYLCECCDLVSAGGAIRPWQGLEIFHSVRLEKFFSNDSCRDGSCTPTWVVSDFDPQGRLDRHFANTFAPEIAAKQPPPDGRQVWLRLKVRSAAEADQNVSRLAD